MKNFLFINKFPNELNPEREIRKGRAWSQFEAFDLFYVFHEYLVDVWYVEKGMAIRGQSMFHRKFLIFQLNSKHAQS